MPLEGNACNVDTDHGAISDQTDQSVLGQKAQAHDQRLLEGSQAVLLLAHINDIKEDRGARCRSREPVLDSRVRRVQLGRDRIGGDVLVMGRQRVARKAKGASPETSADIDLAEAESQYQIELFRSGFFTHQ